MRAHSKVTAVKGRTKFPKGTSWATTKRKMKKGKSFYLEKFMISFEAAIGQIRISKITRWG